MTLAHEIAAEVERIMVAAELGVSIPGLLRADERKRGFRVFLSGTVPWMLAAEWSPDCVVSLDGSTVRLVLITATSPGGGAFGRLIAAIKGAGLSPCVIKPTREFQRALKCRGWRGRTVGSGFRSEDQWMPRA